MPNTEFKTQRGFTLGELMRKPNLVLEAGDDIDDDEDDQVYGFNNRNISNEEMMKYLNIDDNEDSANPENDGENQADSIKIVPCNTSFEDLKVNMTDVTGEGKIFKSVKQVGVGEVVPMDAMVYVQYMGYFEYQDEPFDSSYLRQTSERVRLNKGVLLPGLEIGIQTMKKHEISHFIIHPDYAFGPMGCPPRIPPNEEVMFAVYLSDFVDNAAADTYDNLDQEERKSMEKAFPKAMAVHATANDDFNRNRTKQAARGYQKVVKILESIALENEEEQTKQQKALTKAYVNLGICYNKLGEPRKACTVCRDVPVPNAKAFFTHGKALMTMGEYDRAMEEFHKSRMIDPNNQRIVKEIKQLNERIMAYKSKQKKLFSKWLQVKSNDKEMDEHVKCARELCEELKNNPDVMRQPLPAGLNDRELDCFKQQAATMGLFFTSHERFGHTNYYISKPSYEPARRA
ncbi:inactive peptidyl-prolyl cis-trans isomerase FKBP6 [Neodiprion virginianus]|uniref:inactive peptidyl-prolyl cis-trans isomerase FKBP6 n=1 Tax=Neodiprion virginianus TaxID=2961670 RepID=UPI001EE6D7A0|nr:inactive peptidyl-prolyl cis-trans isomerase FKBP6 [Neodiprion virginianus]XP_046613573.1 inactive peptidyl-prolyl cis-trans isomerase FKBP6 [Neodiprion virginianus]